MRRSRDRSLGRSSLIPVLSCALALLFLLAGCSDSDDTSSEQLDPPAQVVQELLELRVERSADASSYAEYLLDPAVAQELAVSDEESPDSTVSPIPQWEEPYVSGSEEGSASVVVVWVPDEQFSDWPVASVFIMESLDGIWKAGDAALVAEGDELPQPEN